jgi:pSer/pThr/pTyr-binding forkhead associated (FHA) protein
MAQTITFQVLEGVDKGRVFRELSVPLTIGREEGNLLRLNDERISRFHAKVQQDGGDIILTDLESTNGTRVNGNTVQIRRLLPGDRVGIGRSVLLFGSNEEIAARMGGPARPSGGTASKASAAAELVAKTLPLETDGDSDFEMELRGDVTVSDAGDLFIGTQPLPPLPQKLTPAQVARLAEILDFLHRGLSTATENINASEDGTQITLGFADWQKIQMVQMLLARYVRAMADPDA